jgi:hypothetical protein
MLDQDTGLPVGGELLDDRGDGGVVHGLDCGCCEATMPVTMRDIACQAAREANGARAAAVEATHVARAALDVVTALRAELADLRARLGLHAASSS